MSSFWPFRRTDTSPASFEKTLIKLSSQIQSQSLGLERTRSRARRTTALFTLYSTLLYLLYSLILFLVLGFQNWRLTHWLGLVGGVPAIWGVRRAINALWQWRVKGQEGKVDELTQRRGETIRKLKEATKYDSTEELIKKYGGAPGGSGQKPGEEKKGTKRKIKSEPAHPPTPQGPRTGIAPPATANIPGRRGAEPSPSSPLPLQPNTPPPQYPPSTPPSESFAPNAFSDPYQQPPPPPPPPPLSTSYAPTMTPHWYDRILDVLLGEDETLAKNRLALICRKCRLVNGQAPPGVRTLEEVGPWRCGGCGAENGEPRGLAAEVKGGEEVGRRKVKRDSYGGESGAVDEEKPASGAGALEVGESLKERMRRKAAAEEVHAGSLEAEVKQEDDDTVSDSAHSVDEETPDAEVENAEEDDDHVPEPDQTKKGSTGGKSRDRDDEGSAPRPRRRVLRSGKGSS